MLRQRRETKLLGLVSQDRAGLVVRWRDEALRAVPQEAQDETELAAIPVEEIRAVLLRLILQHFSKGRPRIAQEGCSRGAKSFPSDIQLDALLLHRACGLL
eukprot:CAMPEP_0170258898 /NCGR_PEP_ID=MMETSP0116_2-20130129/29319_1 /TAXON_ID=400756 /ORGANISM="Durinskia baltica, Strain CSIRO CS-38" /LENGTH=100 /DNA_ID=CAMNT_0010509941 /DNA_START=102 /DNA_END=401 /DNA_ORIENTATION=+